MSLPAGYALGPLDRVAAFRRPDDGYRRAFWVGLALSAALHLLIFAAYPPLARVEAPAYAPRQRAMSVPADAMRAIGLAPPGTPPSLVTPQEPVALAPVAAPAEVPGAPRVGDTYGTGLVAPGPTAAERMRPRLQDARLWAPLDPAINALTEEQRIELELAGRIVEWNDSMAAAAEAARRGTDWTHTDAQGRRWGVSEGQLHLGGVTLPLPFAFGTPVGQRDAAKERAWEWEELTRGAATGEVRGSWKDRARAIRERRDRERAQAKPDTSRIKR